MAKKNKAAFDEHDDADGDDTAAGPEAEASGDGPAPRIRIDTAPRIRIDTDLLKDGEDLRLEGLPYPVPDSLGGGYLIVQPTWASFVERGRTRWDEFLRKKSAVKEMLKARKTQTLYGSAQDELIRKTGLLCIVGWKDGPELLVDGKVVDTRVLSLSKLREVCESQFMKAIPIGPAVEKERHLHMPFFNLLWEAIGLCNEADAGEIARLGKFFELGASEPSTEDD